MSETNKENLITKRVPFNFGPQRGAQANARLTGPCGDTMEFWFLIIDGCIQFATYTTDGCIHSLLCGSAAASLANGLPLDKLSTIQPEHVLELAGDIPEDNAHCATLAVNTMRLALDKYRAENISPSE